MKNFKNYNLFNVLIFNLFFCFYAFSQDINNPDQYAKDVNERIEKSSKKELRLISKSLLDYYLKTNEDLNLEIDINAKLNNKVNNQQSLISDFVTQVSDLNDTIQNLKYNLIKKDLDIENQLIELNKSSLLIKEKDSLIEELNFNMNSKIISNVDDFLNKLSLFQEKIDNQSFKLVPHGIITKSYMQSDNYDNSYVEQFVPLSDLTIGVNSEQITHELTRSFDNIQSFMRAALWNPIKKFSYINFLKKYQTHFPTFKFTQGRLLDIKSLKSESSYLVQVYYYNNPSGYNYTADNVFFFQLVDNNQKKLYINTVKIGDEIYIYFSREAYNKLNFPLYAVTKIEGEMQNGTDYGRNFDTSDSYDRFEDLFSYHIRGDNSTIIEISTEWDSYSRSAQDNESGLYFFTKNSSTGVGNHIIPEGFLFKLEEIN